MVPLLLVHGTSLFSAIFNIVSVIYKGTWYLLFELQLFTVTETNFFLQQSFHIQANLVNIILFTHILKYTCTKNVHIHVFFAIT